MNRFPVLTLTAATLFLGASAFGQFPTLPYNPDDNADGLIGVADLQGLLSQYGNEFSASVLSSDVALVRIDQDGLGILDCLSNCNALPGPWQMLTTEVAALNINAVAELVPVSAQYSTGAQNYFWTEYNGTSGNATKYYTVEGIRAFSNVSSVSYTPRACLCYAQGRPHIEYDFCYLEALPGDDSEFRACLDSKASEGWYPLGGVAQDYGRMYQAFWRWEQ